MEQAQQIAREIGEVKGYQGGRFYVNEYCNAFAPKGADYGIEYIFVQKIDLSNWFPKPEIEEAESAAATE